MNRIWLLMVVALVAGLDQASKWAALSSLTPGQPVTVINGFFDLTLAFNRGASFSSFADWEHAPLLLVFASLAAICVAGWLMFAFKKGGVMPLALALITGGAAGNLVDRLRLGSVVDFIDLYYEAWHFPVFNLADSAITIGGVLAGLLLIRGKA